MASHVSVFTLTNLKTPALQNVHKARTRCDFIDPDKYVIRAANTVATDPARTAAATSGGLWAECNRSYTVGLPFYVDAAVAARMQLPCALRVPIVLRVAGGKYVTYKCVCNQKYRTSVQCLHASHTKRSQRVSSMMVMAVWSW